MARFTRADIRSILGEAHTDEIENKLIALHLGVVDPLKDDLTKAQADAAKLTTVQAELDALKNGEDYKTKYENEHTLFEQYKQTIAAKEATARVESAYRTLLKETGVDEKRIDAVVRVTDFANMKLSADGKLENADALANGIKTEWAGFIVRPGEKGANVDNPPDHGNDGGANPRAKEIAAKFHEMRYGKAPSAENKTE